MKFPKIGDSIIHDEPEFNRVSEGKVTSVLSRQFTYRISNQKHERVCMFGESWKYKDE